MVPLTPGPPVPPKALLFVKTQSVASNVPAWFQTAPPMPSPPLPLPTDEFVPRANPPASDRWFNTRAAPGLISNKRTPLPPLIVTSCPAASTVVLLLITSGPDNPITPSQANVTGPPPLSTARKSLSAQFVTTPSARLKPALPSTRQSQRAVRESFEHARTLDHCVLRPARISAFMMPFISPP